jgi:radical SAM protein with 4Fe4S-binding SPASM domain
MKEAGIKGVSISIDGMEAEHDALRGKVGSWQQCFQTALHLQNAGIPVGCNTQINAQSVAQLPFLYGKLKAAGFSAWQLALTVPMGNAVEANQILLQPYELIDLFPLLAHLSKKGNAEGIRVHMGNNVGYFGPYERMLKAPLVHNQKWAFNRGCAAGQNAIGIEANGNIKGCPSLPSSAYVGGNIRQQSLHSIYHDTPELRFNDINDESDAVSHLWGDCASCEFAAVCRAGCHWTSHVFFGRRGNNPYCHHRALKHAANDRVEHFQLVKNAEGTPFDHGIFSLDVLPLAGRQHPPSRIAPETLQFPASWLSEEPNLVSSIKQEQQATLAFYRANFGTERKHAQVELAS